MEIKCNSSETGPATKATKSVSLGVLTFCRFASDGESGFPDDDDINPLLVASVTLPFIADGHIIDFPIFAARTILAAEERM